MRIWLVSLGMILIAAMAYAANRCVTIYALETRVDSKRELLSSAAIAAKRIRLMSKEQSIQSSDQLKKIIYQCSANNGVALAYVTDFDREAGENIREQSVLCRATNVQQSALIIFLAQAEQMAGNAKVKEVRLKQSLEKPDRFQDVEIVIAVRNTK
jgi:hypothetical protein